MRLHVVFGLRTELYPGQEAPEAFAVIDEFSHDENPDWIRGKLDEIEGQSDIQAADIVTVNVPGAVESIRESLLGTLEIEGEIDDS